MFQLLASHEISVHGPLQMIAKGPTVGCNLTTHFLDKLHPQRWQWAETQPCLQELACEHITVHPIGP